MTRKALCKGMAVLLTLGLVWGVWAPAASAAPASQDRAEIGLAWVFDWFGDLWSRLTGRVAPEDTPQKPVDKTTTGWPGGPGGGGGTSNSNGDNCGAGSYDPYGRCTG